MQTAAVAARFNVQLMLEDMTLKGWTKLDLSRRAKVADMSVIRFLRGEQQTARMAKKLATALGYSMKRYLVSSVQRERRAS